MDKIKTAEEQTWSSSPPQNTSKYIYRLCKAEASWQRGKTRSPCLPTARLLTRHWCGTSDNQADGRNPSNQVRCRGSKEKRGRGGQPGPAHLRGSHGMGVALTPREAHLSWGICRGEEAPSGLEGRTGSSLPLIRLAQGATQGSSVLQQPAA